ncbi:hypothetical protein ACFYT5_03125 [Streptomyces anulatus]|uniref:hypothetical protein n=1 Tax=Streptomyces anulatus TaxID=1892 RepID=UPI00067B2237|nr:hypothetical protein [Streptomyces anulatus]KND25901.1 hypothetical protein IQ60_29865 [Streptomyces europaeiscabiei]WSR80198.1 hypothetical protein OG274_35240 [Streptomyces anulatus]GGY76738.1 hypothetical protein GCM10010342_75730 [Streptomyces anulatus]
MNHLYEHDLGGLYLTRAPAHLDDDDAALALVAHFPDISAARVKYGLACRHLVATGDASRIDAYFNAADIGPDHEFDAGLVAVARRKVERMRMLEWEMTGVHPSDTDHDPDTG